MDQDKKRSKAFGKEVRKEKKRKGEIQKEADTRAKEVLRLAMARIRETLADSPSEWDLFYLSQVERNIKAHLNEATDSLGQVATSETSRAWAAGQDLIDNPLSASGVQIKSVLPEMDKKQLNAIRSFMTNRLRAVTEELATKISNELGLVVVGAQSSNQAKQTIASKIGKNGHRRAQTIVRTEIGRVYSVATQSRQEQAKEYLPGLKKQWRRSGKVHSRVSHDLADGQIVGVNEPFVVGGVKLMYPRDPAGPPEETINCGCDSLPYMEHWKVKRPGRQPFSEEEILLNNLKRDINLGRL